MVFPPSCEKGDNADMDDADMDDALDQLRGRIGSGAVLGTDDDLGAYETPARGPRGSAMAVLRPDTVDAVRSVLRWAREHGIKVIPQGANSGLVEASTPTASGREVVLSTERLRPEIFIDPVDRVAVVGAGTRLSELNDAAAAFGLHLPIDLGADPSIGGMAATNTGGSRMIAHGDMRRQILGMRCVIADSDCSVIDELTTLRKDNTGTKFWPLVVGSGGAFGVITDVAVSLAPTPTHRATMWLLPSRDEDLLVMLDGLERSLGPLLSAFEVISPAALDAVAALDEAPRLPFGAPGSSRIALVEASGTAPVEDALLAAVATLSGRAEPVDAVVVPVDSSWAVRHRVSGALADRGRIIGADVSVPRSSLPTLLADVESAVSGLSGAVLADFGHWGDGGVHCSVVVPRSTDEQLCEAVREAVFDVVDRLGGSFSAEHGIGPINAARWETDTSFERRTLLGALSATVDPLGILGHPGLPYRR